MKSGREALVGECRTFTRYLVGSDPDSYVVRKYVEAHEASAGLAPARRFDRLLVRAAAASVGLARLADSYVRVFDSGAVLRRKLVLLLAILETCSPSYKVIDTPPGGARWVLLIRLAAIGSTALLSLVVGTLMFGPLQLALRERHRGSA